MDMEVMSIGRSGKTGSFVGGILTGDHHAKELKSISTSSIKNMVGKAHSHTNSKTVLIRIAIILLKS